MRAAVEGLLRCERDFANGGADQFVWNHGAEAARRIGAAWRAVGAVENGELLVELADALGEAPGDAADPVAAFMAFRRRVGGPSFGRPDPREELAEALVEWAMEHPRAFGAGPEEEAR